MEVLEYYQNKIPLSYDYTQRKCILTLAEDINLYGVRGSGKTSMLLNLLQEEENPVLYIDLQDPKLIFDPLTSLQLQRFIDKEQIHLLVLDHYEEGYLEKFPNVHRLIVISRIKLKSQQFKPIELFPLDYEEFLAFENSHIKNQGFNHFLRLGTLPLIAQDPKHSTQLMKTFFLSSFNPNEQKLLLILAQHHTKHLTTHQIYTFAKEKFKVSKDWLYKTIKALTQEKLILFIEDRYEKSRKKMFLFDFAFAKYLTLGQPFIIQFDTMVALALIKHNIPVQTLGIHGYVTQTNELIISAPFESEESLWLKSQTKFSLYQQYNIQKVTIVTVANSYTYNIDYLHFEALPFNEWSVINDEEDPLTSLGTNF
ncbi:MAG: Putative helix-turn-helix containsing protein [uncultured Sulfurovum sp.]|uniref:Helix-turn-helix containsing protein n=1 Tax=uncultured Sulfurovum sp. TaxID=269237 RepID=A0A6S6TCP6_9BACT|nr:MAG: Putative helix-turn-helix containsing protein [uncultured Sulfurovum sp.]